MRCLAIYLTKGMAPIRSIAEYEKGSTRWLYDNQGEWESWDFLSSQQVWSDQGQEAVCTQ